MKYYLAIDIGASSGRHIVGWAENGEIKTREVYRFPNFMDKADGHLIWDTERLFREVKAGIAAAFAQHPVIESLAIDTWGVDYVLMDSNGCEILPCYTYRDAQQNLAERVHEKLPFENLYRRTGIQFQPFNTIYRLYNDMEQGRREDASDFLMLPEYLNYRLTGEIKKEYTNATTTGLVSAATSEFDVEIIKKLGLPARIFGKLHSAGEKVGTLLPDIADELGGNTKVALCASHDTASAFESLEIEEDSLLLSSGTWSLLGAKLQKAITTTDSLEANFTNEGGVGYFRFLKNITGLWIIPQLRKEFGLDFNTAEQMAKENAFPEVFDINAPDFAAPESMSGAIANWFSARDITPPKTQQDTLGGAYRSLAAGYKNAVDEIEEVTGKSYKKLYITGGGAKDKYLNNLAKKSTAKQVIPVPIEATAVGNIKTQIRAEGEKI